LGGGNNLKLTYGEGTCGRSQEVCEKEESREPAKLSEGSVRPPSAKLVDECFRNLDLETHRLIGLSAVGGTVTGPVGKRSKEKWGVRKREWKPHGGGSSIKGKTCKAGTRDDELKNRLNLPKQLEKRTHHHQTRCVLSLRRGARECRKKNGWNSE